MFTIATMLTSTMTAMDIMIVPGTNIMMAMSSTVIMHITGIMDTIMPPLPAPC